MAKTAPYFPFYVDDWLDSDEIFEMGLECEGAYCRLLACMWKRGGSVPDKANWICNALRVKPAKWKKIRAVLVDVARVIQSKNGWLFNERLTEELNLFKEKSEKSSKSASSRWNKDDKKEGKKPNKNNTCDDANALRTQCHTEEEGDTDTDIKKQPSSSTRAWQWMFDRLIKAGVNPITMQTKHVKQLQQWHDDGVDVAEFEKAVTDTEAWLAKKGATGEMPVTGLATILAGNRKSSGPVSAGKKKPNNHTGFKDRDYTSAEATAGFKVAGGTSS